MKGAAGGAARWPGPVVRADVMTLCCLSSDPAAKVLKRLRERGRLVQTGERRGAKYTLGEPASA